MAADAAATANAEKQALSADDGFKAQAPNRLENKIHTTIKLAVE
jgi:hypothetical protein